MDVTLLGTANPCPQLERAGTAIAVEAGAGQPDDSEDDDSNTVDGDGDGETFLLDCGPMAVRRLVEFGFDPEEIETVFFTHHHMDHNVSFFYFAINSWWFGRRTLTVYGPEGTRDLVESLRTGFRRHIDSWVHERRPPEGIVDVQTPESPFDLRVDVGNVQVTALPVEHSLPTYAYRLDDRATGGTFVFSGDTRALDSMAEFAVDADVLVHDVNARDADEPLLDEADVPARYLEPRTTTTTSPATPTTPATG